MSRGSAYAMKSLRRDKKVRLWGMGNIEITDRDRKQAFALFDQDESTNAVATKLFAGHWYKAKKLHDEYDALPKQEVEEPAEIVGVAECEPEAEPVGGGEDIAAPDVWDVTLQLETDRMDAILLRFSPQEKADAICAVLQSRLNAEA